MRIKTKLSLGLGFLFLLFLVVGGLGAYYVNRLAGESEQVTGNNYESVQYTQAMRNALAEMQRCHTELFFRAGRGSPAAAPQRACTGAAAVFAQNLAAARRNVTEPGEAGQLALLHRHWNALQQAAPPLPSTRPLPPGDFYFTRLVPAYERVRAAIAATEALNLRAIRRQNASAQRTAREAITSITLVGVIAFLAYFTFLFVFPDYIAGPIRELAGSIGQIANKNYGQRLHFRADDEFGEVAASFNTMARKLDEYEHGNLAETLFEKKRLDAVINNMRDAIIGLDENLYILFMNQQATGLLHVEEAAVVDEHAPDVARTNDLMRHLLGGLRAPGGTAEGGAPLKIVADGKASYFSQEVIHVEVARAGEADPHRIGYVIVLKNITRFQELDAARTNFIATISHELKTPISSINLSLRLLEDKRVGAINEEQQHLVDTIKAEAQRLLRITGELLDLTQAETGNIQLHYQTARPEEIIGYAYQALRPQAEQRHLRVDIHSPDSLPDLYIDREKTAWVMVNLLSNAVRYSPEHGRIVLRAGLAGGNVVFSVQDYGKGIAPGYQERIFERYFRVPGPEDTSPGTGLGLAISREFITAQGGRIWVESTPGAGSVFTFTLPLAGPAHPGA